MTNFSVDKTMMILQKIKNTCYDTTIGKITRKQMIFITAILAVFELSLVNSVTIALIFLISFYYFLGDKLTIKQKIIIGAIVAVYALIVLISFYCFIYMDGRSVLLSYRSDRKQENLPINNEYEWEMIQRGCNMNRSYNLDKAMKLPLTFLSQIEIIPYIVLYFNP